MWVSCQHERVKRRLHELGMVQDNYDRIHPDFEESYIGAHNVYYVKCSADNGMGFADTRWPNFE